MEHVSSAVNRRKYDLAQSTITRGTWLADPTAGTLYSVKFGRLIEAVDRQGYRRASVWDPQTRSQKVTFVHRVLWEFAHGPLPDGLQVNHLNGVKHDNRAANLEAVTCAENINHAHDTGLWPGVVRGDRRREVEHLIRAGRGHQFIAQALNIGTGTVSRVHQGMSDWSGPHRIDPDAVEKACSLCGQVKPLDEFVLHTSKPDGRSPACRVCARAKCREFAKRRRDREALSRREVT